VANSEDPGQIATAIVFLDDAHEGNGGLEVVPGSHLGGVRPGGSKRGFGSLEMPPDAVPDGELRMVEVEAGSVVFFGSLLVHRSLPNRSGGDRRTLLYSYQPAGRVKSHEGLAGLLQR
jgi:ectoine hydroxylase-related dioxygenase (phytanoyl-CoA dioxygenase family)